MNYKKILPIIVLAFMLYACDDDKMDWGKDPSHGDVTEAELPLPLAEQILKYDSLMAYTDFNLGIGVGMDLYMTDENTSNIINSNFDEIVIGYAMKHGPMVGSDGQVKFEAADAFVTKAKEYNKSIFGHTLIWHANQNAGYLNSLIAASGNLISNGDFESGDIAGWSGWGDNSPTVAISASNEGYNGTGYAMKLTNPVSSAFYKAQEMYALNVPLTQGQEYTIMFMVKADVASEIQFEIQSPEYNADYSDIVNVGTDWAKVVLYLTPSAADRNRFIIDFGQTAATFFIDDLVLIDGHYTADDVIETTDKTDAQKTEIIGDAMADWISSMVGHYKNDIHAWDVVNEPIKDGSSGDVRDGNVNPDDMAADHFYWVKYLGKDYAVTAFNLARQNGNASDILFINDYNLESNMDKCDGLISYVEYIESQGAQVDGIGTQMHISIDSDTALIEQMFQKLAASGKLIKVSELDVRLGTKDPTPEQLEAQANMYQFVADMYMKYIPVAQQYGITIWAVSDNEIEHEYWLPDESPCLWDANYQRKHAYKGFANGLAGRDVSKEFNGELVY